MVEHRPQSWEGAQVWDLALRCGGQLRAVQGAVLGYDMAAVLAVGSALGVPAPAVAELMPGIEAVLVRTVNARLGESHG